MNADPIVEARAVTKHFGSLQVVDNVNLRIMRGTIHSIIGPNGAGKTTLFNLLTGFIPVTSGAFYYKGEDITNIPAHRISAKGIARSFQITSIFPELTVHENLRIAAQSREPKATNFLCHYNRLDKAREIADEILTRIGLVDQKALPAENLPYGKKRILDIGIALATKPEIILLDEPMAGLQSGDMHWMMDLVSEIAKTLTVIFIDHNIDLVVAISDVITVLNQGRIIAEGTPDQIQQNPKVQEAYLGGY